MSASTSAADAPDGDAGVPQAYVDLAHRLADAAAKVTRQYFRHAPTHELGLVLAAYAALSMRTRESLECSNR